MHTREDGWLDDSLLPSNQLPLLCRMIDRRLVNIQRSLSVEDVEKNTEGRDFFRKSWGKILIEFEGLPLIYLDAYWFHKQERSIDISFEPHGFGNAERNGRFRRLTLNDLDFVDDTLHSLIGQQVSKVYILIRKRELRGDKYRALQDGLQLNFENGTSIIICLRLDVNYGDLTILYPEEIRWDAVRYKIDVTKGRFPWRYRLNRWIWRTMYASEHRSNS